VVVTGDHDEVELGHEGTVSGFTIITPIAYYGQEATEPFVYASVLIDGADTPLIGQDIVGIPHERLRTGLRVRAVWRPPTDRSGAGITNRSWSDLSSIIAGFEPAGEPDAAEETYREHLF
jgi:uncharacterized OB-fold protein